MTQRTGTQESRKERVDRELIELHNELRVVLPGVQVLLGFLLTVPFTQRFPRLTADQRRVYFIAVVAVAVSSILLMAPAAHHRLMFRQGVKERMLKAANVLVIAGTAALAVAMAMVLFLIADLLYAGTVAGIVAVLTGLSTAFLWYGLPRYLKVNGDGATDDLAADPPPVPPAALR